MRFGYSYIGVALTLTGLLTAVARGDGEKDRSFENCATLAAWAGKNLARFWSWRRPAEGSDVFERREADGDFSTFLPEVLFSARSGEARQMVSGGEWTANQEYLASLNESHLTPFGAQFQSAIQGRAFFDLASGDPKVSVLTRAIAQKLGAAGYVGVDIANTLPQGILSAEYPQLSAERFTSLFFKMDLLTFVTQLKHPGPKAFFLEGLELRSTGLVVSTFSGEDLTAGVFYFERLMSALRNQTKTGDTLIVGQTVSFLHPVADAQPRAEPMCVVPSDYGFELTARQRGVALTGLTNSDYYYIWRRL